jgi:exodeoxyribonuclease VIII
MLSVLKRSPKEFYERFIAKTWPEEERSSALRMGSLVHTMVLERDEVQNRYIMLPKVDRRTKEGRAIADAFAENAGDKEVVDEKDWTIAERCTEALLNHGAFKELIDGKGIIEKPIYWQIGGVDVAGTPDYVDLDRGVIVDVKTTQDASPDEFAKSMANYGYHRQAWMYTHGIREIHGVDCRFFFAVVETARPHHAAVYEIDYDSIARGGEEVLTLLRQYQARLVMNCWDHSWQEGIGVLSLPRWYRPNLFDVDEQEIEVRSDE